MDCCNYEYRAGGGAYAPPGWEGYAPYAPLYAPYAHAHGYYAHAQDPYARYYRYDYPHHAHHNDQCLPMDYGTYATKEARVRRALARRDARALPAQHLPLPPTPPLECGLNNRGSSYCEPQMWSHYQMSTMGGGGWNGNASGGAWAARGACARDHPRYPSDCRPMKGPQPHLQSQMCAPEGRSTPYPVYEDSFSGQNGKPSPAPRAAAAESNRTRERLPAEPKSPPQEPRPPVVPLPAFQQAFGSTEIGKFAEAFSRTEVALEDEGFGYSAFPEWEPPEPQWSSQPREIKCEDSF